MDTFPCTEKSTGNQFTETSTYKGSQFMIMWNTEEISVLQKSIKGIWKNKILSQYKCVFSQAELFLLREEFLVMWYHCNSVGLTANEL